jgi:hypothetical protein
MHDGNLATLQGVIEHYAAAGKLDDPSKSHILRRLTLADSDKNDLVEFLKSLDCSSGEQLHPVDAANPAGRKSGRIR